MQFVNYVNFNGNCRDAFEFYHQVLGGEIDGMMTHAEMPMEGVPEEWMDKNPARSAERQRGASDGLGCASG
jgi:PhnB protein